MRWSWNAAIAVEGMTLDEFIYLNERGEIEFVVFPPGGDGSVLTVLARKKVVP